MLANSPMVAAAIAAFGTLALVLGIFVYFNRRRLESARILRERLVNASALDLQTSDIDILRRERESESAIDKALSGRSLGAQLEDHAKSAGLEWSAGEYIGYAIAGAVGGILVAAAVNVQLGIVLTLLGAIAPALFVSNRRSARERRIEHQLPDAIDMLVNALRAGYSLQAGMNFVGGELPEPLGPEFSRFSDEQKLGVDVREALGNLSRRINTLDSRMFILAVLIQRETGGNLSEVLGNISRLVRERTQFREQVEVMTAESKRSAYILGALPVFMYVILQFLNPEYVGVLFTTENGRWMVAYGLVSLTIGMIVLTRMAKIEV